jgi:hypothetical protein
MQLRALDWDTSGPFQNSPAVIVYHPNEDDGHAFANVGWYDSSSLTPLSFTYKNIPRFFFPGLVGLRASLE